MNGLWAISWNLLHYIFSYINISFPSNLLSLWNKIRDNQQFWMSEQFTSTLYKMQSGISFPCSQSSSSLLCEFKFSFSKFIFLSILVQRFLWIRSSFLKTHNKHDIWNLKHQQFLQFRFTRKMSKIAARNIPFFLR